MSNIASITIIISNTKKYNMKYRRSLIKLTVVLGPPASAQTFHPASGARGVPRPVAHEAEKRTVPTGWRGPHIGTCYCLHVMSFDLVRRPEDPMAGTKGPTWLKKL